MRILLVEDEAKVARALREGFAGEGFDVVVAATGEDGFFRASSETFDVVVLDWMLPGRSGIEILRALRGRGVHVARLRKKVDLDSEKKLIHTVRGVGFMLSENAP